MPSNKAVRQQLTALFGKKCFISTLYQQNDPLIIELSSHPIHPLDAPISRKNPLTFHHIRLKSKGGKATIYNGAVLSLYNHQWLHSLPSKDRERINARLQQYKLENLPDKYRNRHSVPIVKNDKIYQEIPLTLCDESDMMKEYDIQAFTFSPNQQELVGEVGHTTATIDIDTPIIDVYEGMSDEEIKWYKEHKQKRYRRLLNDRFHVKTDLPEDLQEER